MFDLWAWDLAWCFLFFFLGGGLFGGFKLLLFLGVLGGFGLFGSLL